MKKFYEEPSVEITVVGTEDVILASDGASDEAAVLFDVGGFFNF